MAHEVLIPPLGQTVDTVTLVTWYKKEGEPVQEGEILFAIETDKATLDVEAQASGVLRGVTISEGQDVQVLSAVALIAAPDEEDVPERGTAQESSIAVPSLDRDVSQPATGRQKATTRERMFVSPRAKRLAEAKGVSLDDLSATGPEGAIVERDVRVYLDRQATVVRKEHAYPVNEVLADMPLRGIRAIIAERMAQSASTTARVTLTADVDATALVTLRKQLTEDGVAVSYNDLFLYILGRVLKEQPELNASLEGDTLRQWKRVHIGLAVDTERGLLVPIIRDVDARGLSQLAQETRSLVERARAGALTPDEFQGGTFTLTNLGMFGVDAFTPIIVLPETAILGVGRIKARPAVRDDEVVIRDMVWLSLAFDHRIVDGGPAARFLQRVVQLIEHPHLMHT